MRITVFAAPVVLGLAAVALPLAASPLSDLAEKHGVTWMLGHWATADGKVKVSYEWRLDQNSIALKFAAGERQAEGMMALAPGTSEVHQISVDNAGGVTTGQWIGLNDNPAFKATHHGAQGEIKTIAEHIKVDDDTMRVIVYKQDDDGQAGEMVMELEFKRQK